MYLKDIHDQLTSAELSRLHMGDNGQIEPSAIPNINNLIKAGLIDLNKHFTLRENELLLRTKLGKTKYELIPENAVSSGNPFGFIIDSLDDPYLGDIQQILKITNVDGLSMSLNTDVPYRTPHTNVFGNRPDFFNWHGANLVSFNTIKFNEDHDLGDLRVTYKARIKPFLETGDPATTLIDVPDHYLNALTWYVASRVYNPMGSETIGRGMFHEGNNYWTKYTNEINELKANMADIHSLAATTSYYRGGWA